MGVNSLGQLLKKIQHQDVLKESQFRREYNIYTPPSINIGKTKQSPRLG